MMEFGIGSILLFFCQLTVGHLAFADDEYNYVALVDAGSSGSRVRVYKWNLPDSAVNGVPDVVEVSNLKKKPGLSSLADNPDEVEAHLRPLIDHARENIPSNKYNDSPIYLMATAGVRLVPRLKRKALFAQVHATLENTDISPFDYDRENSRVLSGEEEGAFSWIAVNYNLGFFKNQSSDAKSVGLLEMGGASAQIAFIPDGQILADKYPVRVGKQDFALYVHSYLYYGQDFMRKRVRQYLKEHNPSASTLLNPCMLTADNQNVTLDGDTITFKGSSNHTACKEIIRTFMWKTDASNCYPSPCTIGNIYQPPIEGVGLFYAIKAFVYPAMSLGVVPQDGGELSLSALNAGADAFCAKNLSEAVAQVGERNRGYASDYCLMSTYTPLLLHDGLGFSLHGKQVFATNSIGGKATEWPLGAVLYEVGRKCEQPDKHEPVDPQATTATPTDNASVLASRPYIVMASLMCAFVLGL